MDYGTKLIIIADDNPMQRLPLHKALQRDGFEVLEAENGYQALELCRLRLPDLLILDVLMPVMDGYETCRQVRALPQGDLMPILMVTGLEDEESIHKSYEAGATDFVIKPVHFDLLGYKSRYLIRSAQLAKDLAQSEAELIQTRLEIINRLGRAAEYRDNETGNHIIRMSRISALIAEAMGLDEDHRDLILHASPMHDIGKIAIPDHILQKKGPLTWSEFEVIKTHTHIGAEMLTGNASALLKAAHDIALYHHERWDGKGYPHALEASEIPLNARICSVADVFDALSSERPYKAAWALDQTLDHLASQRERQFDPAVIDAFFSITDAAVAIRNSLLD